MAKGRAEANGRRDCAEAVIRALRAQGAGSPANTMRKHDPIFVTGPTAVGKSAVALKLAQLLGGEIISVDSMQVYRGLDIGTAKPSSADRALVPHHLIDVVDLHEPFDAAQFAQGARRAFDEILSRGNVPVFCGGTGLYFKAYLEGIGEGPPSDAALRIELETHSLPELLTELQDAQIKLAEEQARYEIAFRQDLATLAEHVRRAKGG